MDSIEHSLEFLDMDLVKRASRILKSVDDPFRIQLLTLLNMHGSVSVSDLVTQLATEQYKVSLHLAILLRSRIVSIERKGDLIYYQLNIERLKEIDNFVKVLNETR